MNYPRIKILLVEDNPADARLFQEALAEVGSHNFELAHVSHVSQALQHIGENECDVILLDLSLPDGHGLEVVERMSRQAGEIPFVVLTGLNDEEMAVKAVRQGAQDYWVKGQVDGTLLARALRHAIERKRAERRISTLRDINVAITSTLELSSVLDLLLAKIDLLLNYSATGVWLAGPNGELDLLASRNVEKEAWKALARANPHTSSRSVFDNGNPLIISNFKVDPRVQSPGFFVKYGFVSYVGVPLIVKNETLGVLSFYSAEERLPSEDEVEFLSTLAGQAAIAIHNSQLHEETKRQAVELQKANNVKDEFLGFISHELKTPVTAMVGYAGLIVDRTFGEINREQETYLRKLIDRGSHLSQMINTLLVAAKVEAGAIKAESEEIALGDFLNQLRSAYDGLLNNKVALTWDYPSDLPVVKTDGGKLRHILSNLVTNAIKFTEKGMVTVAVRVRGGPSRHFSSRSVNGVAGSGASIEFRVADTGIGIPKDSIPLIFEKFHQLNGLRASHSGSVGLGLYIVKRFTELLGGRIEVESHPGEGSTFTLTLPCQG
ncbi:MAG: response regulator [Deltaproteobacteria bacterium]|nr:response regulator [Deltaproteobacteria bacterium]